MIKRVVQVIVVVLLLLLVVACAKPVPACNVVAKLNAAGSVEQTTLPSFGNDARHVYGPWQVSGYQDYQQRSCVRCGWTEFTH